MILITLDTNIKNNITISILYIYRRQEIIAKLVYYTMNITFIKVKLFTIRCGINYAIHLQNIKHIVVIIDIILAAK